MSYVLIWSKIICTCDLCDFKEGQNLIIRDNVMGCDDERERLKKNKNKENSI